MMNVTDLKQDLERHRQMHRRWRKHLPDNHPLVVLELKRMVIIRRLIMGLQERMLK
jgi:hypothetical protein